MNPDPDLDPEKNPNPDSSRLLSLPGIKIKSFYNSFPSKGVN